MIILENYRKTESLLRKLGGLAKGFGFTITVSDEDPEKDEVISKVEDPKKTAEEVAEIIKQCTSLDELEQYKDDKRQIVSRLYKAKLKELTNDTDK